MHKFFLAVLETRKSKIKVSADSVSSEGLIPGSQTAVFHCVLTWQKGKLDSLESLCRGAH